jgi:hypothetical protein
MGRHRYRDLYRLQHLSTVSLVVGSVLAVAAGLALPSMTTPNGGSAGPVQLAGDTPQAGQVVNGIAPQGVAPEGNAVPRQPGDPTTGPTGSPTDDGLTSAGDNADPASGTGDADSSDDGVDNGGSGDGGGSDGGGVEAPPISVAGFPDSNSTGWQHTGVTLSTYTGSYDITTAGTVIDGKLINRCLEISAKDVVIKRSKIVCGDIMLDVHKGGSLTVQDTEMDGKGNGFVAAYNNFTMIRVNIHNINEGPRIGSNVVIQDCFIHDLAFGGQDGHQDVLQTNGGSHVIIRHNRLEATSEHPSTVPHGFYFNAVFMVGAEFGGPTADILFEDNLARGGDFAINIRDDPNMDKLVFKNNQFGGPYGYGPVAGTEVDGVQWDRSTNVVQGTNTPVHT